MGWSECIISDTIDSHVYFTIRIIFVSSIDRSFSFLRTYFWVEQTKVIIFVSLVVIVLLDVSTGDCLSMSWRGCYSCLAVLCWRRCMWRRKPFTWIIVQMWYVKCLDILWRTFTNFMCYVHQKDESFYTVSWACNIDGTPFIVAGGLNGIMRIIDAGSEKIHKVSCSPNLSSYFCGSFRTKVTIVTVIAIGKRWTQVGSFSYVSITTQGSASYICTLTSKGLVKVAFEAP